MEKKKRKRKRKKKKGFTSFACTLNKKKEENEKKKQQRKQKSKKKNMGLSLAERRASAFSDIKNGIPEGNTERWAVQPCCPGSPVLGDARKRPESQD